VPPEPAAAAPPSDRTTVKRARDRGRYDAETVHAVLDEALICHLGVVVDGSPVVLPTIHARTGDTVYVHGAPASRMLRLGRTGDEICVTATIVDGLVIARSAFHHSMNYRSVVVLGAPREVTDRDEKVAALEAIVEHVVPGRTPHTRAPNPGELTGTLVLALPLDEASAKVRTGPPIDDEEDYGLGHWAGVVPLRTVPGPPSPDPRLPDGIPLPAHVAGWARPSSS
jgi:nitroimidazol reductase NimA-like FMN-containing flavoprotein (pyridoxamine 5'-phosphate oxidase superfamily)